MTLLINQNDENYRPEQGGLNFRRSEKEKKEKPGGRMVP